VAADMDLQAVQSVDWLFKKEKKIGIQIKRKIFEWDKI
jgi:hypothetical protein